MSQGDNYHLFSQRNSNLKQNETANLKIDLDNLISQFQQSRKNSQINNIKDISTYSLSTPLEKNIKPPQDKQYLKDFTTYLNKKYIDKKKTSENDISNLLDVKQVDQERLQSQKANTRQDRIQYELKRKLKLQSKSKEAKFNEIFGVFKRLDTYIEIKPFLHDLNLVNNTKMYNSIQDLKQRIAEKKGQQEVDMMLKELKKSLEKQEIEQEEENKILKRGMKEFVQKQDLLTECSNYFMKKKNNMQGIMSDKFIDHFRQKNTSYQELIDCNDPDIDAHLFYDQLSKQLFQQKTLFRNKQDFSQTNTRRASMVSNQDQQKNVTDELEIQQLVKQERKNRKQIGDEDITEEEKLRIAQESLKVKFLTIDGFQKDDQDFSDQLYFETYQEKAEKVRKNLQKATESIFKHKWANANIKLKKIRQDEFNSIMTQIQKTKEINYNEMKFPSKNSFKSVFQGKIVESKVAKALNKPPKDKFKSQSHNFPKTHHQVSNISANGGFSQFLKTQSKSGSRSNSNFSRESSRNLNRRQESYDYQQDQQENDDDDNKINSNSESENSDSDDSNDGYLSKKWKQIKHDRMLSRSGSFCATPSRNIQTQQSKFNTQNKQITEGNQSNKSLFHTHTPKSNQQNINKQGLNIQTQNNRQSFSQLNQLHQIFGSNQQIAINKSPSATKQITNQYFFPSSTRNSQMQQNKSQTSLSTNQPQYSITARKNTEIIFNQTKQNMFNNNQDNIKSSPKTSLLQTQTSRNGFFTQNRQSISSNRSSLIRNFNKFATEPDQIYDQFENGSRGSLNNPPCTPNLKEKSNSFQRKQSESYKAVEKHLLNVKFNKFLMNIDNEQTKFGMTKEKYEHKINQIQKKFDNEIAKFEPPKLDIFKFINNEIEELNIGYKRGKLVNNKIIKNMQQ